MTHATALRLGTLSVLLGALLGAGCSSTSTCSRDSDWETVPVEEGIVDGKSYRSSDVKGPFKHFPPNHEISFEHGLGVTPLPPNVWVAFAATGTLAPAAGNMAELRTIDADPNPIPLDDQRIALYNDTCSDLYVWVSVTAP